jgi:hypothetical protein
MREAQGNAAYRPLLRLKLSDMLPEGFHLKPESRRRSCHSDQRAAEGNKHAIITDTRATPASMHDSVPVFTE